MSGSGAPPVSAVTVMGALAPTLTVATASAPMPGRAGNADDAADRGREGDDVRGRAGRGGRRRSVFTPGITGAGFVFAQSKLKWISVAGKAWLGVREKTKDAEVAAGNVDGRVRGANRDIRGVGLLVGERGAQRRVGRARRRSRWRYRARGDEVAKAVAGWPTCTAREPGRIAAPARVTGRGGAGAAGT